MVIEAFEKVYDHPLIDEIIIVDDASTEENWIGLNKAILYADMSVREGSRIKLFRNPVNLGMSRNKAEAVSKAKNEWVILFDSDNILYPEYLDGVQSLLALGLMNKKWIYHPAYAEPDYDFSELPTLIDKFNAKNLLHLKEFRIFANTCNYIVNRDEYLKVYKYDETIKESDTIHFNYLWLKQGNAFFIIRGMKYFHRRHDGSGWLNGDHKYNMNKAAELQEKIKNL